MASYLGSLTRGLVFYAHGLVLGLYAAAMLTALAASQSEGPLSRGIELYQGRDYAASLSALTEALASGQYSRQNRARARLYIGLIQYRFKQRTDARSSFREALKLHPKIRIPRGSPRGARRMLAREKTRMKPKKRTVAAKDPPKPKSPAPESDPPEDVPDAAELATPASPWRVVPPDAPTAAIGPPPPPPGPVAVPPPPVASISEAATVVAKPEERSPWTVPGWIGVALGTAGVAAGGTLLGVAVSTQAQAQDEMVAQEAQRLHERALKERNIGIGVGAAGVALAGAGLWMLLVD